MEDGDGVFAVFSAEAADGAFGELGGVAGFAQAGRRGAEEFGEVGDFFAPIIETNGAEVFAEGVGLEEDFVLDALVGVVFVIQIHGVFGSDDPVGGGDAAVGGADGETPVARGAGEEGFAAAGEAFLQLSRVILQSRFDLLPGIQDRFIQISHLKPPF